MLQPFASITFRFFVLTFAVSASGLTAVNAGESMVTIQSLLAEMVDRDAIARFPVPHFICKQASSYDRTQTNPADAKTWFGNNDFDQFIRTETNEGRKEWVIMNYSGPGAVVRFWHPLNGPQKKQIIRFYFDGEKTPTITANLNQLLSGRAFIKPPFAFVGSDEKAFEGVAGDIYLPIPFARGCKITTDSSPFYYVINYRAYPSDVNVETFTMARFAAATDALKQTKELLEKPLSSVEGQKTANEKQLDSGEELAISLPEGGAAVRAIQVKIDPKAAPQSLRSIVIEAAFDGQPTVWCPLGEFFGCGARLHPVTDWDRSVAEDGTLTAAWVMSYQRTARIAIKNYGKKAATVKLAVETRSWQWDDRSMYFHADWRCQKSIPTKKTDGTMDWNYLEMTGKGVYVGDTLTVLNPAHDWYGEGDERVYIDGEKMPSHMGTGTEDYYGYAWGMARWFNSPFISMPLRDGKDRGDWSGYTTTSRVRLLDGIPVEKSLKFDMEIWHWAATKMDYTVGVFWYGLPDARSNRGSSPKDASDPLPELSIPK